MTNRIGSIIRADNSGLGTLAREFWDNGLIQKALIYPNGVYKMFPERFPGARISHLSKEDIDWLLTDIDTLLFFETPFEWDILEKASKKGIKTVIMPMYECLPNPPPAEPDLWLCPSTLDYEIVSGAKEYLPIPINTSRIKWHRRAKAMVFVHNAGHGGIGFRNGTVELLEAMKMVHSPIKLILRSQSFNFKTDDPRVEVRFQNVKDYWDIWGEGDVFIFPEKFNGLSLPIQEAVASGMMVMSTKRKPFSEWLPIEPLLPVSQYHPHKISRTISAAYTEPIHIAQKIDEWYGKDISHFSDWGREWAEENSWRKLKPKYVELLSAL